MALPAPGHVAPEHGIHPGLVTRPLTLEPVEDISVNPQRDGLFRHRQHQFRIIPEIGRQIRKFRWRGALDVPL